MSNNETIEYGYVDRNGNEIWPDLDGDLYLDGRYWNTAFSDCTVDEMLSAAAADSRGIRLIERTITRSESRPARTPLPTAPGSVVRATFDLSEGIFCHDDQGDTIPWRCVTGDNRGEWVGDDSLSDVTVLFDAAEAQ